MEISGASTSGTSDALQVKSLQLQKSQQEQEGQAALQLIESADVPKSSSNPSLGSIVDTFA